MGKKLTPSEQHELEYLRKRCLLILEFVLQHSEEPFPSAPAVHEVIEQARTAGNLRGMRVIRSDLLDLSRALSREDRRALEELLKAQTVQDPFSADGTV